MLLCHSRYSDRVAGQRPLTLFVFVFRQHGMHFRFKINGIKAGQLQLKQDKNTPTITVQSCKKLPCCCTVCSWCISNTSSLINSLICGLVTALTFKMCGWSDEDSAGGRTQHRKEKQRIHIFISFLHTLIVVIDYIKTDCFQYIRLINKKFLYGGKKMWMALKLHFNSSVYTLQ